MTLLALVALVASVLVWASPDSQAQSNQAPYADAGDDQSLNPGGAVTLNGGGSTDTDGTGGDACGGCSYEWEIEAGPYDWIRPGESADTQIDVATTAAAFFNVPSQAFVDKVSDDDPQKYEIVVRLTVTDNGGATDTDTVSININQRPVADIQVYAGLRDKDIVDGDLGAMGHFPLDAVIDGPGENGNRDNEWDIREGAYLQLDGSASTDENPTGRPAVYQWTRVRPTDILAGYAPTQTGASATGQRLDVAIDNEQTGDDSNVEAINFGDLDSDGNLNEAGDSEANPPQIAEMISVAKLPDVAPNMPQTVFYQLTVCDAVGTDFSRGSITDDGDTDCTGLTSAALVRIVVHDSTATPEVSIKAGLTAASSSRGDAEPQETVGQITGVENQFLVAAGSAVVLTAAVKDGDQPSDHNFRWSGATPHADRAMATVRVPADADSGDTIDVSVTVTDATRISVTTDIQLKVTGPNTAPTAEGVPANQGSINNPQNQEPELWVHQVTDGFQNRRDGSTVTLRGVGNDADGDSIITAWSLRDAPDPDAFDDLITAWLAAKNAESPDSAAIATAAGAVLGSGALQDLQEPERPLLELDGAFTDTVSFDVPNLETGKNKGAVLIFTVIDSNGASDSQLVYIRITADDDVPNADAGADQQVDPGSFVRLNGSASSDPDVGDKISHKWEYVGATMDPAPNKRSPLSANEIDGLDGWILAVADDGTWKYIVNAAGMLTGSSDKLKGTGAYPYFDAPDFTGFNNIKLMFRLHVKDSGGTDIDSTAGATTGAVASLDEANVDADLNGDGDKDDTGITMVKESILGLDLNDDGDAEDTVDLSQTAANEANVAAVDSDTVTITVVNRFFSGDISSPDFCTGMSLGGPQTYAFDSDGDGVADICALNTTRRATVARQNALETLAGLNPNEFRTAVLGVCGSAGFKQRNYGDDPSDLEADVCETERVTPPPAAADPATADMFFSGAVTGPDFCTNHSLGGARLYAFDSDGDGVADVCSLPTTRREAIARQNGLNSFIVSLTAKESARLAALTTDDPAADASTDPADPYDLVKAAQAAAAADRTTEQNDLLAELSGLQDKVANEARYNNALAAACRALGTQDFGDSASNLARDECVPTPRTGQPLS